MKNPEILLLFVNLHTQKLDEKQKFYKKMKEEGFNAFSFFTQDEVDHPVTFWSNLSVEKTDEHVEKKVKIVQELLPENATCESIKVDHLRFSSHRLITKTMIV